MLRREFLIGLSATGALAASGAHAQSAWPQAGRTIKVIVPWPPGAANDALGRLFAQRLQETMGATTVVENRVGGAGLVGTNAVIQAEPDGYTFLASAFNTAVMPKVLKAATFDPEVDLEAVARTAVAPLVCVMSAARPEKTLAEVIASAKENPRNFTFAISSLGSAGHLATVEFLRRTGLKIDMVPYRGTAPALQDLMGGSVQLLIDPSFALLPAAADPTKVKALAIASRQRSVLAPMCRPSSRAASGLHLQLLVRDLGAQGHAARDPGEGERHGPGHDEGPRHRAKAHGDADRAGRRGHRRDPRLHQERGRALRRASEEHQFRADLMRESRRLALVTGASSGIGEAIVRRLLANGWNVVGAARRETAVDAPGYRGVAADLGTAEGCAAVAAAAGGASALVHAAGFMVGGRLGELAGPGGERMWRLHVQAAEALAEALAPQMAAGGRIVLIGSRAANGAPGRSRYAATKAALVAMARSWAAELAPRGITVNVVRPRPPRPRC